MKRSVMLPTLLSDGGSQTQPISSRRKWLFSWWQEWVGRFSSGRSALANAHAQPRASVAAFDPRDTSNPERIGERRLELERLPIHHWIQMLDE